MFHVDKDLIMIDGQDKTLDVDKIDVNNNKIHIYYKSNIEKKYSYNNKSRKVFIYKNPKAINPNAYRIKWKDKYLNNIEKILDFGEHLKVFYYNKNTGVYKKTLLKIDQNALGDKDIQHILSYLKALAKNIGGKNNDFLDSQYEKMSYISDESVLYKYLKGIKPATRDNKSTNIFPFGLNLSQEEAVIKALSHQVSIIEGPPGTGKTQTILNIIANLIMQDKTIAIASNNNSATKNVYDKLESYGLSFFTAVLGNIENQKLFFENQSDNYSDLDIPFDKNDIDIPSRTELEERLKRIKDVLQAQNDIAQATRELNELRLEKSYFMETYKQSNENIEVYKDRFIGMGKDKIFSFLGEIDFLKASNKEFNLIFKLKAMFKYRLFSFDIYQNTIDEISLLLQNCFYEYQETTLQDFIMEKELFIGDKANKDLLKMYEEDSMLLLKLYLIDRYDFDSKREVFNSMILRNNHRAFTNEYPVILSTTHSLRNCTQEEVLYDYLIIDEASQVDIVAGALALSCARNVVIVGDNKQLPHVVDNHMQKISNELFETFKPNRYLDFNKSLLSSVASVFHSSPRTMLREHYRCHPKIIDFCNKKFYHDELIILSKDNSEDNDQLVLINTAKGNHARGKSNQRQIDVIKNEILPFVDIKNTGVISPFREQVERMNKDYEVDKETGVEIDTVHKYQGREKDTIIITTVVDKENKFADDPNLLNVAISRAKKKLFVVVSESGKNRNMKDLVNYIKYHRFETIESKTYSIFDLLYKSYSPHLEKFLHKIKKVSSYESENLMATLIEEVLLDELYANFSYLHNYPLSKLIKDTSLLNVEESRFVSSSSHIDFMIYNTIDKQPVLAVEVDGVAFHANNPKQLMRDEVKNCILNKYEIPLIRFATDGSEEKIKLYKKLKSIIDY